MTFLPFNKMDERSSIAKDDSDIHYFNSLLYYCEMLTKFIALGLIAAIEEENDRHKYRLLHKLVRADGIGEWAATIEEILSGPPSQHLMAAARDEQRELTEKGAIGTWQYDVLSSLFKCFSILGIEVEGLNKKEQAKKWFNLFAQLRNKTRGHGAQRTVNFAAASVELQKSIDLFKNNFILFKRQWAYLYRNLSGKYRVTKLSVEDSMFAYLKTEKTHNVPNGVYVYYAKPTHVELIQSDLDAFDFFLSNGGFTNKKYELLSYITGNKITEDAGPFLIPANELPESETQGIGQLDVQGKSFGNLPPKLSGYIERRELEQELKEVLINDRHPVVTLVGRGGIGKTSLALSVLHDITNTERFAAILWFSARDIDLLPCGPKVVKPHVLTEKDIAKEFVKLVETPDEKKSKIDAREFLATNLKSSKFGGSLLFVFDNFETVRNPVEVFKWIDTYIRIPNKVLITTRYREFKGDYPIVVGGMNNTECEELINATCKSLGISLLLGKEYKNEIIEESEGHPYVIKILLGEVAKAGKPIKVERIIASKEDILDALFERTFVMLSPAAKRVYLTLCSWHSHVPQIALEAVLLRPQNERMDVAAAVEELHSSSFVELTKSEKDDQLFISVPLVASVFGAKKLSVDPMKISVEADKILLSYFGATQESAIKNGIFPRIERLFQYVAQKITSNERVLDDYLPMLEYVCNKYTPARLFLAELYEEIDKEQSHEKAKNAYRKFLEDDTGAPIEREKAWQKLAALSRRTSDWTSEVNALSELAHMPNVSFEIISEIANRYNGLFRQYPSVFESDEKQMIVKKLANIMKSRLNEADATDYSRVAWLMMQLHEEEKAKEFVKKGLDMDSSNDHCKNLALRLHLAI